ncbi:MAG: hypothetical protein ACKVW3_12995 [Phycisphaerales bacterium]
MAELIDAWREREKRKDFRAGQVCALLAEVNRDHKKKPQPFSPADFFGSLEDLRPGPPSDEELEAKFEAMARGG